MTLDGLADADLGERLDVTLAEAGDSAGAPGVQAALVRAGSVVWTGRYGVTDLATADPVTDDTMFCLASLGKTPVAALALRLVEEGGLELDAPIGSVLGEIPGAGRVTVRMLLTHTSGYPDVYESPELAPLFPVQAEVEHSGTAYDPDRPFDWGMLLPGFREPVEPGVRWEYSNGGYIALTEVLVRLLGGPDGLAEAWASLASRAAGDRLTDDLLTLDRSRVRLDRLAHGYEARPDGTLVDAYAAHPPAGVPTDLFGLPFGDGLFAGTAIGAALLLDGLFVRRTVLQPSTLDLMTTPTPQAAAAAERVPEASLPGYGMGTFPKQTNGRTWQGHSGTYGGFNVLAMSDPERGQTLAVLTNAIGEKPQAGPIWEALVDVLDPRDVTAAAATG